MKSDSGIQRLIDLGVPSDIIMSAIQDDSEKNSKAEASGVQEEVLKPATRNKMEEDAVRKLGDAIGYGRLMQLASILWSDKLIHEHKLPGTGAFVPAIHFQIKKSEWARMKEEYPNAFPNK